MACGPSVGANDGGGGPGPDASSSIDAATVPIIDASPIPHIDANHTTYPDATVYSDGGCGAATCDDPVPDNCDYDGPDICGDGIDNNCNLEVDEGCACTPGSVQPCFLGPPGKRGVGACTDGSQTCHGSGEFTYWGDCTGGIWPGAEVCDSLDNSCDGCVDDNPECCEVELACPSSGDLPEGNPFQDYVIDGTAYWSGTYTSWSWTVVGGPCDQLLDATSGQVSYTLSGIDTPVLTLTPTLSGDYTVTMTVVANGETYTCTFIVHIAGPGLRVELCWDTTGSTDIDLHLHKPDTTSPWFTTSTSNTNTINPDDCYYYNCDANAYCVGFPIFCLPGSDQADWSYSDSALAQCDGSPHGDMWTLYGGCPNPRLDIDNIEVPGKPENINVDTPLNGKTYRAMVHYWGGSGTTHPMVNIYCGGHLKTTYGADPDFVPGFTSGGGFAAGTMWRVADVTPVVSGGVTTDCTIEALHPAGAPTEYWVTTDDRSY